MREDKNRTFDAYDTHEIPELLAFALEAVDEMQEKNLTNQKELCMEVLKTASVKTIEAYMRYTKTSNYENAYKLSRQLNVWAKKIKNTAMEQTESHLYMMGFFNGTLNACKGFASGQNEEAIFTVQMSRIIGRKGIRELLQYLYYHNNTQNKKLCDVFEINSNLLHKRIEPLIEVNCVVRYAQGKYAFYSLSDFGRKYVKNVLGYPKDGVVEHAYVSEVQYKKIRKMQDNLIYYKEIYSTESLPLRERYWERAHEEKWEAQYARYN